MKTSRMMTVAGSLLLSTHGMFSVLHSQPILIVMAIVLVPLCIVQAPVNFLPHTGGENYIFLDATYPMAM